MENANLWWEGGAENSRLVAHLVGVRVRRGDERPRALEHGLRRRDRRRARGPTVAPAECQRWRSVPLLLPLLPLLLLLMLLLLLLLLLLPLLPLLLLPPLMSLLTLPLVIFLLPSLLLLPLVISLLSIVALLLFPGLLVVVTKSVAKP